MTEKMGRPTKYSKELAAKICSQITEGKSLRTICRAEEMPSTTTIFNWMGQHEDFLAQYTRAKQEQADALIEDMLDIADDQDEDTNRSRLRVDTRKWIASKLKPKKYGDKLLHGGDDKNPIKHSFEWSKDE